MWRFLGIIIGWIVGNLGIEAINSIIGRMKQKK